MGSGGEETCLGRVRVEGETEVDGLVGIVGLGTGLGGFLVDVEVHELVPGLKKYSSLWRVCWLKGLPSISQIPSLFLR